jgi:hypothetical protein
MFTTLFNVIAPVVLCLGVGFVWGRSRVAYAHEFVTRLIILIGAPCLIVSSINGSSLATNDFLTMAGLTLAMMAGSAVVGILVFRLAGLDVPSLSVAVIFSNAGNMGLSLSLFAFGRDGLALALIIFVTMSLTQYTSADLVLSREGSLARRFARIARQPLVYGALVAFLLIVTGWKLPPSLARTTGLLGDMTIPLMLLTLGVSLARLEAGDWAAGGLIAVTRLGGGLLVGLGVVWLFGVSGLAAKVLVLQSAMPSAVFNYLLALKYDRQPGAVASGVVISTFCSFVTLPIVLTFLL